jgi:hypothetical protein
MSTAEKNLEITPLQQQAIAEATLFLDGLANRLDQWAEQSRVGGWSTHQVDANIHQANECRRAAAKLRFAMVH